MINNRRSERACGLRKRTQHEHRQKRNEAGPVIRPQEKHGECQQQRPDEADCPAKASDPKAKYGGQVG